MAVNYRMGRRGAPLTRLNAQPRQKVKVWHTRTDTEPPPPPPPILTLTGVNQLYPVGIENPPDWLAEADFTLTLDEGVITFVWSVDHWNANGSFPAEAGAGVMAQDGNEVDVTFFGATWK